MRCACRLDRSPNGITSYGFKFHGGPADTVLTLFILYSDHWQDSGKSLPQLFHHMLQQKSAEKLMPGKINIILQSFPAQSLQAKKCDVQLKPFDLILTCPYSSRCSQERRSRGDWGALAPPPHFFRKNRDLIREESLPPPPPVQVTSQPSTLKNVPPPLVPFPWPAGLS